jgi:hypothetical protein
VAVSQLRRVTYIECPACHRTKAVLADTNSPKRCFSCPHCQHLWDTAETAHEERSRVNHRTTELRKEPEVSRDIDRGMDRRVAELVAHVRHTLALLNQEAGDRFLKDALSHEILKTTPFD